MGKNSGGISPMSNEGRNTYVIQHLTDALLKLLSEKSMQEIFVSELCGLAGVGRASFYRNFESKEDILKKYITRIFHEWIDECGIGENPPLSELLQTLFLHFERHHDFYKMLSERGMTYLLKDIIIEICGPKIEHSKEEAYAKAFVAYSLFGWIEVWFQRGMQESPDEIASLFQRQGL